MNHKERHQQLEIEICNLIEAYNKETGLSVSYIRFEYIDGSNLKEHGSLEGRFLVGISVTAEA